MRAPSLSLNGLMTLAAVVEHGSFTRAAEALGVSQAAVSQLVRDLERICGLALLIQNGRTLVPTPLGEELALIGRRIALESRRAEKRVAEHAAGHAGHVTIGASMTTGVYLVPRILAQMRAAVPGIHVRLEVANTEDVAEATVDGIVDIGIVEGPVKRPELAVKAFRSDELQCIATPAHRLVGRPAKLEDLTGETLLIREPGSGSREVLLEALAGREATFGTMVEISNPEAIIESVSLGVGVSWVSGLAIAAHPEQKLARLEIADVRVMRTMSYLRRRDIAPTPATSAFVALLERPPLAVR